jgi:hypothetical protein
MELKYLFHHAKIYLIFQKNPLKETKKSFKIYYNSIITNLKFQHELAKISSFKNPHRKIDLFLPLFINFGKIG